MGNFKNVVDKDTLQILYVDKNLSLREIGARCSVSKGVIARLVREFGLKRIPKIPSHQEVLALYQTLNATEIAEKTNCSPNTIIKILREEGIDTSIIRHRQYGSSKHLGINKQQLEELYCNQHLTYEKIAEVLNCDFTAIPYWLKKFGIPKRNVWESRRPKGWIPPNADLICHLYTALTLGTKTIGAMFAESPNMIRKILRENNVKIRHSGYPNTDWYITNDGHKVRSELEVQVDNWLYQHSIEHIYDPRLPNSQKRSDFLVDDIYIEVWGIIGSEKYDQNQREKKELYHTEKLILISLYKQDFPDLKKLEQLL